MSSIIPLETESLPSDCYVYKHSTQCPISGAAADVVKAHNFELPVYWVNVIEQRPISNWVAEHLDVIHHSPQLILIKDGKVIKNITHRDITSENIDLMNA